ncbi:hypothetical protein L1987_17068 [Smallanthus sonchifolius]|uniref:Uncharacterized protein n=1 Tax=Smallanthus sonchifolius TaxID=185202 RepID=A0ACB9IWY2_9ASTR|nr:hypothetical protein L1987_17068 [Smallanthus sonchifolius]
MNSYSNSQDRYPCFRIVDIVDTLHSLEKEFRRAISLPDINQLYDSCKMEGVTVSSDKFREPMVWIGIYVAIASFFCILAMAADLVHGFQNKKFWFPCKYFSLNAASITVITITLKLPVDLSSEMPSYVDQAAKLGSLGFMCTMMANLMPSLASMDNKTLLANLIGLSILVITMIVNICIQLNTRVINRYPYDGTNLSYMDFAIVAYVYTAMILLLLIIMIFSSLTIPTTKEILESKYQATHTIHLDDQRRIQMSIVERLRHHVTRYWVMAETGSPQFVMAINPLSTASGIICALSLLMNLNLVRASPLTSGWHRNLIRYESPYMWSTTAILITQSIGVVVGTIAPILRSFSLFSFKLVITKWNRNHFIFFKVEKYWTQKLCEWKKSPIPFLSSSPRSRNLIFNSKSIILSFCIGFQKGIVASCKLIWLIVIIVPIFAATCLHRLKSLRARWFTLPIFSRTDDTDIDDYVRNYALQIDGEMEVSQKALKGISKSINSIISKAKNEQNNNLLELLEKSKGFEGVEIFDTDHVQPLLPVELVNTWSLPIVTLTCIVVALSNIHKDVVETLLRSVGEGLSFTHLVEESLNCTSEYVNIRKITMILWHEVENNCKWLDNPLAQNVFKGKTATYIIKWFSDKAKEIVTEINGSTNGELVKNPPKTLIAANSMYRITQTILLRYQSHIEPITKKQLFAHLNGMIADILSACFTNLPRVITMRCNESVIEKREASVIVAAKLLGKTTKILERLETCDKVPSMDEDKMAYIDEWRLYLKQSIPVTSIA